MRNRLPERHNHGATRHLVFTCLLGLVFALFAGHISIASASTSDKSPKDNISQYHPLEPPNTSSPRATLETFLNDASEGWLYYLEHGGGRPDNRQHAIGSLDLSQVPQKQQKDVGLETAIMLFDVFNRIPLPVLEDVPDEDKMDSEEQTRWVVPHTPITIAQVAEGPRAGEWLFTPETIKRTPEFYRQTRHMPVKHGAVIEHGYRLYLGLTGWMIPSAWLAALPDAAHAVHYEQTIWQWTLLGLLLVVSGLLAWTVIRWSRRALADGNPSALRELAGPVLLMLIASGLLYIADEQINITGVVLVVLRLLLDSIFYLNLAWFAVLAVRLVVNAVINSRRIDMAPLNAELLRLSMRILSFFLILVVVAVWLNSLGIPVLGVLAGFGIGGIAVALAAKRTIENFFGAIMLFSDRPVRIGDFCRFDDKMGTVERIGLRSTRIRTPERSILNVPNAEFSRFQLENLAERDRLRLKTTLNLRLETAPEQLQLIIDRVRGLLLENDDVHNEPARVRLVTIGPLSLDIEILAYIKTTDFDKFLAIQEDLFLEILREVKDAGTALAPPAQIQYEDSVKAVTSMAKDSSGG
jgi:MscS family membrane protein